MDLLPGRVEQATTAEVDGTWHRHVPARFARQALVGHRSLGRWGTPDGYPVLYLSQPFDSVVVEAYRHLVDPVEGPIEIAPRVVVTCTVRVAELLDLRTPTSRMSTGLTMQVLQSETHDRAAYRQCREVAGVAHQLGRHGIIAPAATQLGFTLALFTENLADNEEPAFVSEQTWLELPADPRGPRKATLRVVDDPS